MKTLLAAIILFSTVISLLGNDGLYLPHGGTIFPIKETKISMDKEILSFTVRDRIAFVDIQFEFNNPEDTARKLWIGF